MRPRGKSGPIQRNRIHPSLRMDVDYIGEAPLSIWLVVSSRYYRGTTTTIRQIATVIGKSIRTAHYHVLNLCDMGLLEYDHGTSRTIRPAGKFGLELVEEPPCLTRLKDELAHQCQPRGDSGPTQVPAQAA